MNRIKSLIVKSADKYPKMLTSSVTLKFLKSFYKGIKIFLKKTQSY